MNEAITTTRAMTFINQEEVRPGALGSAFKDVKICLKRMVSLLTFLAAFFSSSTALGFFFAGAEESILGAGGTSICFNTRSCYNNERISKRELNS
jgi:hypothetical protein